VARVGVQDAGIELFRPVALPNRQADVDGEYPEHDGKRNARNNRQIGVAAECPDHQLHGQNDEQGREHENREIFEFAMTVRMVPVGRLCRDPQNNPCDDVVRDVGQ